MRTGLLSGVLYGAELNKFSQRDVASIMTAYYKSKRLDVPWVPNYIKDIVSDVEKAPDVLIHAAPILAYTREVWIRCGNKLGIAEEGLTAKEIVDIWRCVAELSDEQLNNSGCEDSIGVLTSGFKFFGAVLQSPTTLTTRRGCVDLEVVSGRKLRQILARCRADELADIWSRRIREQEEREKVSGGQNYVVLKPDESIDVEALRKHGDCITAGNRRQYLRVLAGVVSTREKAMQDGALAPGQGTQCSCGDGIDNQWHRLWGCKWHERLRGPHFHKVLGAVPDTHSPWSRLIFPCGPITTRLAEDVTKSAGRCDTFGEGKIFIDGSCFEPRLRVATAGAAAVQLTEDGGVRHSIKYSLPDYLDQSAVVAEIVAALIALRKAPGPQVKLVADCAAVVGGLRDLQRNMLYNKMHAGLWRQVWEVTRDKAVIVEKTKAHRARSAALASGDLENFDGNESADSLAKEAARDSAFRELEVIEEKQRMAKVDFVHKYWLQALGCFYDNDDGFKFAEKKCATNDDVGNGDPSNGHLILGARGGYQCFNCLVGAASASTILKRKCEGHPAVIGKLASTPSVEAHNMWACKIEGGDDHGFTLVFCSRCGCTSVKKMRGLARGCAVPQRGQHKSTLKRIAQGMHPDPRKQGKVSAPRPFGKAWFHSKCWVLAKAQGSPAANPAECQALWDDGDEGHLSEDVLIDLFGGPVGGTRSPGRADHGQEDRSAFLAEYGEDAFVV